VFVLHGSADRLRSTCGPVCPFCIGPRIDYDIFVDPVSDIDGAADRLRYICGPSL
jgi:hypothetical protein